jgi:hypothetical protein
MPDPPALRRALKFLERNDRKPPNKAHAQPKTDEQSSAARRTSPPRRSPMGEGGSAKAKAEPPTAFRHDRKCCVCRHPERDEIENEFLRWRSPERIAQDYGIANHCSIYRHAHATGLFAERATHLKLSLAPLIERAVTVPVTADSIVRAIIAFAHIDDEGKWVNPPKHVIHESRGNASSPPVGA